MTNQRVEVAKGSTVSIICRGLPGSYPTWKKETESTATSLPKEFQSKLISILIINSLTTANAGVYACHIGVSTIETVTVG